MPKSFAQVDQRGEQTRRKLVDAAIEVLSTKGYLGATTRAIAAKADCNQALVGYHFRSVDNLLVAALDEVSRRRMERYRPAVERAASVEDLLVVATEILQEDLAAGHLAVLTELLSASTSRPELARQVAERLEPWMAFTRELLQRFLPQGLLESLVPAEDLAYGVVALYLGMELLTHLGGGQRDRAESMLATFARVAALVTQMLPAGLPAL